MSHTDEATIVMGTIVSKSRDQTIEKDVSKEDVSTVKHFEQSLFNEVQI